MNRTRSTVFAAMTLLAAVGTSELWAQAMPPAPPSFMDALAAHGTWRNDPAYGWYWRPFEADRSSGWRPYLSGGCWQWIADAWHWTSDYVWGATVFHYGRWANVPSTGWIWIPGQDFSPAWVHWVRSDNYWGWAPVPPVPGSSPGFTLAIQLQPTDYVFVPESQLSRRNLETVVVAGAQPAQPVPAFMQPVVAPQPYIAPPVYATPPVYYYDASPIVIRQESRYFGPSVWWSAPYPFCSFCGAHHRGSCSRGGYHSGGHCSDDHNTHGGSRHDSPPVRIVPVPTVGRPSRSGSDRPSVSPAPTAAKPVPPSTFRPQANPAPTTPPSRRAAGIQGILQGR